MVSYSINVLYSMMSILLYLTTILCLQNEHVYQQFGHEERDQYNNQVPQDMSSTKVERSDNSHGEITAEHLLRYWGSTTDQLVDSMHIVTNAVNFYPDKKQQQHISSNQNPHSGYNVFVISSTETTDVNHLRRYIMHSGSFSRWLQNISDTEILRFLRARKGDIDAAWVMLWEHSNWRQSPMGSETLTPKDNQIFEASSLNDELYWAGQAYDGNPVLFFRSGLHQNGADALFYTR